MERMYGYYHYHFTDEETRVQGGLVFSLGLSVNNPGFNSKCDLTPRSDSTIQSGNLSAALLPN